eukprot:4460672-Prymnesium_polylepis.1
MPGLFDELCGGDGDEMMPPAPPDDGAMAARPVPGASVGVVPAPKAAAAADQYVWKDIAGSWVAKGTADIGPGGKPINI